MRQRARTEPLVMAIALGSVVNRCLQDKHLRLAGVAVCAFHITHPPSAFHATNRQGKWFQPVKHLAGRAGRGQISRPIGPFWSMMNCALIGRATRRQNSRATEENARRECPSRTDRQGITQEKLAELVDLNIRSAENRSRTNQCSRDDDDADSARAGLSLWSAARLAPAVKVVRPAARRLHLDCVRFAKGWHLGITLGVCMSGLRP